MFTIDKLENQYISSLELGGWRRVLISIMNGEYMVCHGYALFGKLHSRSSAWRCVCHCANWKYVTNMPGKILARVYIPMSPDCRLCSQHFAVYSTDLPVYPALGSAYIGDQHRKQREETYTLSYLFVQYVFRSVVLLKLYFCICFFFYLNCLRVYISVNLNILFLYVFSIFSFLKTLEIK